MRSFLEEDPVCEVIPTGMLDDELGFRPTKYTYWHLPSVRGADATFHCQLDGYQTPPDYPATFLVSYFPGGRISTALPSAGPFTDLDDDGLPRVLFEGVEGRGYVLTDEDRENFVEGTWLYPDDQTLTLVLRLSDGSGQTLDPGPVYDQGHLDGMRALLQTLVPAVPPIAAGPGTDLITSESE